MIKDILLAAVHEALHAQGVEAIPTGVVMERPARREHGDWSTNAALVCKDFLGGNPRAAGEALAQWLRDHLPPHVEHIDIAGPGFVNFRLAPTWLHEVLTDVVTQGQSDYGRLSIGAGQAINVEFVSANPTGPLHAGGGRWGAFGDSLCRIFERCGYAPHREYYINDRGVQTKIFGASLSAAKNGEPAPENGYVGEYIEQWAHEMPVDVDPVSWGRDRSLAEVRSALAKMNVDFDTWSSEKALVDSGAMEQTLAALEATGHVYREEGATWLRTSGFGDDKDRVLVKADGEPAYFLPDIAYHRDKFARCAHLIDVLGADHHGYVKRMEAAMKILGHDEDDFEIIIGQNVRLVSDGQEIKMSKRAGTIITIDDLVDVVGPDVARFAYLTQSIDTALTLDLDVLQEQAKENPVYYPQYANARIHSIGRKAGERGIVRRPVSDVDLSLLDNERELEVLRQLSALPEVLELACNDRAPHRISHWVRELAAAFHGFYHDHQILAEDVEEEIRQARLWLVEATRVGLSIGLDLLGVSAPELM